MKSLSELRHCHFRHARHSISLPLPRGQCFGYRGKEPRDFSRSARFLLTGSASSKSRLIFLNLPATISPEAFKTHLLSPPTLANTHITDTKLVQKRRFAFVGYKSEDEARKVRDWFDGSFTFGGGKVKVDFVRDDPLSAPPSKKAKLMENPSTSANLEPLPTAGPSKRLQEFMDVMKGVDPSAMLPESSAAGAVPGEAGWVADGLKEKEKGRKGKEKETVADAVREVEVDEGDDDAAWLRKRQKAMEGEAATTTTPRLSADEELILSTGRLFVRNLSFLTDVPDLTAHFSTFGPVEDVHLPLSHTTSEPLGTAFILYTDPAHALEAYRKLDRTIYQGRLLHVLPGRARPGQERVVEGVVDGKVLGKATEGKGAVKKGVDEKRKEESAKGVNWASMYMNSDAVAASVADRMGISKSELLNGDTGNAAVKLALAETSVIEETKKYFEDEGIVIESLSLRVPRSQTTILVKNIPYGTTIHTLTDLFAPHGTATRILLPPAGTLGVVEFENSIEAGRAFKALAYRRLGNAVLYLEKGPIGMFKQTPSEKAQTLKEKDEAERKALLEKVAATVPDSNDEAGSTLFLKNLSFSTTTARLHAVLSTLPGFSFTRVQTKPDPKRTGETLSMGYGFAGFKTKDEARKALSGLEGLEIDGKVLEVKWAGRGAEDEKEEQKGGEGLSGKTKSTKVLVKNLPFEATRKDVKELFSAYGQLKSVRLPKKPTSLTASGAASTRGFAFLEFTTHSEAVRAMEALKHTHLLGRHLVLEWARQGDAVDVDSLREKVGRDWKAREKGSGGKRKLDLEGKEREAREENDGMEE
ncbi:multiple RNA-binding domain-containing protein 1, partial [Tremellales sp. Uapishka_1]